DTNSTDVRILIKGDELAMDASLDASEDGKHVQGRDGSMVEKTVEVGSPVTRAAIGDTISAGLQDDAIKSSARQNSETRHQGVSLEVGRAIEKRPRFIARRHEARHMRHSLKAHKAVLDGNPYFYRMLNSGFKESQPTMEQADDKEPAASSKRSTFNIVLSSNLFPIAIMDFLLDYLYCRRPFPEYEYPEPTNSTLIDSTVEQVTLKRPVMLSRSSSDANSQPFFLGLNDWGALYRVGLVLEIQELELMALEKIRSCLDVDTVMDEFMDWGYRHEAVKALMMDFLVQKRHVVFGSESDNQLRSYLHAEYDEQVDTLVQLTSRIAKK
ncbi:hypothetical protein BGZ59_004604, partial [Podila verticillata]